MLIMGDKGSVPFQIAVYTTLSGWSSYQSVIQKCSRAKVLKVEGFIASVIIMTEYISLRFVFF